MALVWNGLDWVGLDLIGFGLDLGLDLGLDRAWIWELNFKVGTLNKKLWVLDLRVGVWHLEAGGNGLKRWGFGLHC